LAFRRLSKPIAEIAAIGDDMHLRHGHGDAEGKARQRQDDGERVGADPQVVWQTRASPDPK